MLFRSDDGQAVLIHRHSCTWFESVALQPLVDRDLEDGPVGRFHDGGARTEHVLEGSNDHGGALQMGKFVLQSAGALVQASKLTLKFMPLMVEFLGFVLESTNGPLKVGQVVALVVGAMVGALHFTHTPTFRPPLINTPTIPCAALHFLNMQDGLARRRYEVRKG